MDDADARPIEDEINLLDLFLIVWDKRLLIAVLTALFLVGSIVTAFVLPRTYSATATVLPLVGNSGSSQLSQLAGLASLAGVNIPSNSGGGPGKTLSALLKSRLLASRVVQELNLVEVLAGKGSSEKHLEGMTPLISASLVFQKMLKTKEDAGTGVISITVDYTDQKMALDMANGTAAILDRLLAERDGSSNEKKESGLNRQIAEQEINVRDLQNQLVAFQKTTSLIDPKGQTSGFFQAYANIVQQKMGLEVQLAAFSDTMSSENPRITAINRQIASLDSQIAEMKNQVGGSGDLPSLKQAPDNFMRYQNIIQDLEVSTRIYAALMASREQVRLQQQQNEIFVEVLDPAFLDGAAKPSRLIIILGGTSVGLFLGILAVFLLKAFENFKRDYRSRRHQGIGEDSKQI